MGRMVYDSKAPRFTAINSFIAALNSAAVYLFISSTQSTAYSIKLQGILSDFAFLNNVNILVGIVFILPSLLFLKSRLLTVVYFYGNGNIFAHYYKVFFAEGWVDEVLKTR